MWYSSFINWITAKVVNVAIILTYQDGRLETRRSVKLFTHDLWICTNLSVIQLSVYHLTRIRRVASNFSRSYASVPKDDANKKVIFFQEKKHKISSVQYSNMYIS